MPLSTPPDCRLPPIHPVTSPTSCIRQSVHPLIHPSIHSSTHQYRRFSSSSASSLSPSSRYDAYGAVSGGTFGVQKRRVGGTVKCILLGSCIFAAFLIAAIWLRSTVPASDGKGESRWHARAAGRSTGVPLADPHVPGPTRLTCGALTPAGGPSHAPQQLARLTTKDIVQALPADMRSALDTTVDPCDDFYHFSCGGWQKATEIPTWQSSWAKQWDGVTTFVEKATVKALEKVRFGMPIPSARVASGGASPRISFHAFTRGGPKPPQDKKTCPCAPPLG